MAENYYDSARGASEYLLFHYGAEDLLPPPGWADAAAQPFPARCVELGLDAIRLPAESRALDLGCAVGRSAFELARHCAEVIGIDFSEQFVQLASQIRRKGSIRFKSFEEGELTQKRVARVPQEIDRSRAKFEVGDATRPRRDLGAFDVVFMANLIDRLREPKRCLERLPELVLPEGQLIITSPYTWLASYTPPKNWLGGFARGRKAVKTFNTLSRILTPHFELRHRVDVPFLLREHARKYQLGVAELSSWVRRE